MIRTDQRVWLEHLSDKDEIVIKPYDTNSPRIFETVKVKILAVLGTNIRVEHRGASSFRISGQDEIDIYLPIPPEIFSQTVKNLVPVFGKPRSLYPLKRARFPLIQEGKHVDVFVINDQDRGWTDSEIFDQFLRTHQESLDEYRKLKEEMNGVSTREYYTGKIEFINRIIRKAKNA